MPIDRLTKQPEEGSKEEKVKPDRGDVFWPTLTLRPQNCEVFGQELLSCRQGGNKNNRATIQAATADIENEIRMFAYE